MSYENYSLPLNWGNLTGESPTDCCPWITENPWDFLVSISFQDRLLAPTT